MPRQIIVTAHPKNFRITVPDEAKITFGPWSPGGTEKGYVDRSDKALNGTLRIYAGKTEGSTLLGVFSGVTGFRDMNIEFESEEIVLEGSKVWKSDSKGYVNEERVVRSSTWDQLPAGNVDDLPGADDPEGETLDFGQQ